MAYGSVTVTNTSTLIVGGNTQRLSLFLVNADTETNLYVGSNSSVTTTTGLLISPLGAFAEDSGGTKVYCGDIYGICDGTITVTYWERP